MNETNDLFYVCSLIEYIGRERKLPKSGTCYPAVNEVLNIVVYRVIRHWTFNNVMGMRLTVPTRHNKIKPFLRHVRKSQNIQSRIGTISEMGEPSPACKPYRPPNSLLTQQGTVESIAKILGVFCPDYARGVDNHIAAMTDQLRSLQRLTLFCTFVLHASYYTILPQSLCVGVGFALAEVFGPGTL